VCMYVYRYVEKTVDANTREERITRASMYFVCVCVFVSAAKEP
jgi:hypothetical protein